MTTWNLFLASPKENSIFQMWTRGRRCKSRMNRSSVWIFPHTLSFLSEQSPEASTGEHTQCPPQTVSTMCFSQKLCCILVFWPYVFHPLNVHFTPPSLTERPKPQEQNKKPKAHLINECHLPGKKAMCVQPQRNVFDHTLPVTCVKAQTPVKCSIPAVPIPTFAQTPQWVWCDQN